MKQVELNKFNKQRYVLTFVPQTIPPMAEKISKKRRGLNYKQYNHSLRENGYMSLQIMKVGEQCPIVNDIMASPFSK